MPFENQAFNYLMSNQNFIKLSGELISKDNAAFDQITILKVTQIF